jgi:hypothetical protein
VHKPSFGPIYAPIFPPIAFPATPMASFPCSAKRDDPELADAVLGGVSLRLGFAKGASVVEDSPDPPPTPDIKSSPFSMSEPPS